MAEYVPSMHKRRHGRIRARGLVSHVQIEGKLVPGLTVENVSLGGAFVRTSEPAATGSRIVIDLVRPGLKKAIRVVGRVVSEITVEESSSRKLPPGMGIAFDPLTLEVETRLRELLLAMAPDHKVPTGDGQSGPPVLQKAKTPYRPPPLVIPASPVPPAAPAEASEPASAHGALPAPPAASPADPGDAKQREERLMVQIQGLLRELGEVQGKVRVLQKENEGLRAEVGRLKAERTQRAL